MDPFVDAEQIELLGVQHTAVALRPPELGRTYLEDEFDEWAVEQPSSWAAEAEVAARPSLVSAAKAQSLASTAWDLSERQTSVVDTARGEYVKTMRALAPFVRREAHAKFWYLLRWGVLLGGDVAGIGRVDGAEPPTSYVEALKVFYRKTCEASRASSCSVVTDYAQGQ